MDEEKVIKILMVKEIAEDICDRIFEPEDRRRCRIILYNIILHGKEYLNDLKELSDESLKSVKEGLLEDLGIVLEK